MAGAAKYSDIQFDDDFDAVSENNNGNSFHFETPAFVFCVDGGMNMFETNSEMEISPILLSFQCIRNVVRNYIVSSSKCSCALMLTGCDKTENEMNLKHICVIKSMSLLGVETMKVIDDICKSIEGDNYNAEYGYGKLSLSNTLWSAATIFSQLKSKVKKKVILFTNDDNPCASDSQEKTRTFAKVADYETSKIELDVLTIGPNFDTNKFYKDLLQFNGSFDPTVPPSTTLPELLDRCSKVKAKHVALANIPFYLSKTYSIDVSVHNLVRKAKIPAKTNLSSATNQVVTSKLRTYNEETGEEVKPESILKYETLADQKVYFNVSDMKKIAEIGERRIRLLGFKPKSELSFECHVKPGAFIYPSESLATGGNALFKALLERCFKREVVAICTFCPRPTSSVRFVALVPQLEVVDASNNQITPPGFQLVFLPFGDEVRDWNSDCTGKSRATTEQVQLMKDVIKKLRFNYKPECFPNPQLANYWACVEAVAFNLSERVLQRDETHYERIAELLQDLPDRFQQEIYSEGYSVNAPIPKKKRDISELAIDFAAVEELARTSELHKLKVDILKSYLKHVGLGYGLSSMKKDAVVDRIYQHLKLPQ